MTSQTTSETRDQVISGLLALCDEYEAAGMDQEMRTLLAAARLLVDARREDEDE